MQKSLVLDFLHLASSTSLFRASSSDPGLQPPLDSPTEVFSLGLGPVQTPQSVLILIFLLVSCPACNSQLCLKAPSVAVWSSFQQPRVGGYLSATLSCMCAEILMRDLLWQAGKHPVFRAVSSMASCVCLPKCPREL